MSVSTVSRLFFDLLIYAMKKNRSGRWTVSPTGNKKGAGIQGISTASAARAETLFDALGTRLQAYKTRGIPGDQQWRKLYTHAPESLV